MPQDEINDLLVRLAASSRRIVRLKGGDPFVFGRGGEEAQTLVRHGIPVEVVPGITAALGCAAAAGIPLTHRDAAQSVRLVTGHRRDDSELDLDWSKLADPNCTLVIYMGLASAERISDELIGAGLAPDTPVALIERGTTGQQRTHCCPLDQLAAEAERSNIRPPALMIIGKVVDFATGLALEMTGLESATR